MKVHFISIGGSVMHQLAIALKRKGYKVSGTDDEIFEPSCTNLKNEGLLPGKMGWQPDLIIPDIDAIILGMHAKDDNPELVKAREMQLPIYSFPEYIFKESQQKTRVVVGGSHGKTTTTSMIMHVLKIAQKEFDYLVGARLEGFDQSVNITDAPVIVCEGDEYPASAIEKRPKFHFLFPHIAILTGIAWDHINVFPTWEFYLEQFVIFINKIEKGGILIFNETDPVLTKLVQENKRDDIRYQPYAVPGHEIANGKTIITIEGSSQPLQVFGDHNLLNLHAAYHVCNELGVDTATFVTAISSFTGASKRLEKIAETGTTTVYRDFAHAPSKVKATIEAVKQQFPGRKLVAVLELHTFSSLNENFMSEYEGAMDKADAAVVFYSQHALELKRMPPLPKKVVEKGFNKEGLEVITDRETLEAWLQKQEYTNATLVFMSSGNYDGLDVNAIANAVAK
ncbi:UDP-N-acetylmuramate--L-alanine ligase [Aridibaculum aurantiacum]|uniref:UDP-N-acetylmuramate--L-alanine ligase n=1 Tax=Aridibaculum aurantiacum TaxID=2810307 RepID=UPI001A95E47C|nr:Mur ligase family protein [Aridibaculum aurantiacum]